MIASAIQNKALITCFGTAWVLLNAMRTCPVVASDSIEVGSMLKSSSGFSKGTDKDPATENSEHSTGQLEARLQVDTFLTESLSFHLLGLVEMAASTKNLLPSSVFRNPEFERSFWDSDSVRGQWVLDQGYGRYLGEQREWSLGRFPINLSKTFIFTPNDLFQPFGSSELHREFKPGVDALRVTQSLGPLSQISILGVAGFKQHCTEGCYSPEANSYLLESGWVMGNWEMGILGGKFQKSTLIGTNFSGELSDTVSLRLEGHLQQFKKSDAASFRIAQPEQNTSARDSKMQTVHKWAGGLESTLTSDFFIGAEIYHENTDEQKIFHGGLRGTFSGLALWTFSGVLLRGRADSDTTFSTFGTFSTYSTASTLVERSLSDEATLRIQLTSNQIKPPGFYQTSERLLQVDFLTWF